MQLKKLSWLAKCQAGNVGIMFAIGAVPMLLAIGASVDMVRANRAQAMLQAAVDASVLAVGSDKSALSSGKVSSAMQASINSYLESNDVNRAVDAVTSVATTIDAKKGSLRVKVAGTMNTSLMAIAGISKMDVDAVAEVELGNRALDLVLVLDNTGSMSGTKITNLKSSANNLVDILFKEKAEFSRLSIGVVPYSEYVNVGLTDPASATWLDPAVFPVASTPQGCVGSRSAPNNSSVDLTTGGQYPLVGDVHCGLSLLPLTTDQLSVNGKINAMVAGGATYIPGGLLWGWNVLTPEAPYTEGMTVAEMASLRGSRAMVLMTDGENTISANTPFHDGPDSAAPDVLTLELCAKAKADGINLFTVGFQTTAAAMDILTQCASSPDMAFDAANPAALNAAFTSIGQKLATLYLSK